MKGHTDFATIGQLPCRLRSESEALRIRNWFVGPEKILAAKPKRHAICMRRILKLPESQLRGFERIHLLPGESQKVSHILRPNDLALLDKQLNWMFEPGTFKVMAGSSSTAIDLTGEFQILGN